MDNKGGGEQQQKQPQKQPPAQNANRIVLKFDESKIVISDGNELHDGGDVVEGTRLILQVKSLPTDKVLDCWKINGAEKTELNRDGSIYVVKKADAKEESDKSIISIDIKERAKSTESIKIIYGAGIGAEKDDTSMPSNTTCQEGDKLVFTYTKTDETKTVDYWTINGNKQSDRTDIDFDYTVNINDARGASGAKEIEIGFVEKERKSIVVNFDESKIKEVYYHKGSKVSVAKGDEVLENTWLIFVLKDIPAGNALDYFTINGEKAGFEVDYPYCYHTIKMSETKDVGGKPTIEVGIVFRGARNAKLNFSENDIIAEKMKTDGSNGTEIIHTGAVVSTNDTLFFTVKEMSGKTIEKFAIDNRDVTFWKIPDTVVPYVEYIVVDNDMKQEGGGYVLNVQITTRTAEMIQINFDPSKISCKRGRDAFINGTKIEEDRLLIFEAKDSNKQYKKWQVRGVDFKDHEKGKPIRFGVYKGRATGTPGNYVITVSLTE